MLQLSSPPPPPPTPQKTISYQILLKHQVFIICIVILFQVDTNANTNVLNATIEYVLSTKRFEESLFQ